MIISIPHTGTRCLRKTLGIDKYWHFGVNDPKINAYEGIAHIPLRDPFDVAVSWTSRYQSELGRDEIPLWEQLIAYSDINPHTVYVKVENIPCNGEWAGPEHWAKGINANSSKLEIAKAKKLPKINALRSWIPKHMKFFEQYDYDFWWL